MSIFFKIYFRSKDVLFKDLVFQDCELASANFSPIVEIEGCEFDGASGLIHFRNIQFVKNELANAPALFAGNSSCSTLKMTEVAFMENSCKGLCFAHLAASNELQNISMVRNKFIDNRGRESIDALIFMPSGSTTDISQLKAKENHLSAIRMKEGSAYIADSSFSKNSESSAIHLIQSTAILFQLNCSSNKADTNGGCLYLDASNVSIEMSRIVNNSAPTGGAIYSSVSHLVINNTEISKNEASNSGGGILITEGTAVISNSSIFENTAQWGGGFLCNRATNVTVFGTRFEGNHAENDGGGMRGVKSCRSYFDSVTWSKNSAKKYGGAVALKSSQTSFTLTLFSQNEAKMGGAVDAYLGRVLFTDTAFGRNNASEYGGAINLDSVATTFNHCLLQENFAQDEGGAIAASASSFTMTRSHVISCRSTNAGGGIYITESTANFSECVFDNNESRMGAGLYMFSVTPTVMRRTNFTSNQASAQGGAIFAATCDLDIYDVYMEQNSAFEGGGMYSSQSSIKIAETAITLCRAEKSGGAMKLDQLTNCTIQKSNFTRNYAIFQGGALVCSYSSLHMEHVRIANNEGHQGGGFATELGGNVTLRKTNITSNYARGNGGGFSAKDGTIRISNCALRNNLASQNGGAGFMKQNVLNIRGSSFRRNRGLVGGSLALLLSAAVIESTSFEQDFSNNTGGSLHMQTNSSVRLAHTEIVKSQSLEGGAIYVVDSELKGQNVLFKACNATNGGGVSATGLSDVHFSLTSFDRNTASEGGGFYAYSAEARWHAFQFDRCIFGKNNATLGGKPLS